jgi:drug/metabolite transporter superfamily protein YnfA
MKAHVELFKDVVTLLRERKKWWLLPVIIFLAVFGILLVLAGTSAIAPFIYTLF